MVLQPILQRPLSDAEIRFQEVISEWREDEPLSGYNNLGNGANTVSLNLSANVLVNAQGGSDTVIVAANDTRSFTIYGGSGGDDLHGGAGRDTIYGGSGGDEINGGGGDDTAYGGSGNDIIDDDGGGASRDTFYGGTGDDHIEGGAGNDTLSGGLDDDTLLGQGDADRLFGNSGADTLDGGAGRDELTGGSGADTFRFRNDGSAANPSQLGNPDHILDFSTLAGDTIDLTLIDSNTATSGFQHNLFETNGPSDTAGALWFEGTGGEWRLFINTDSQKAGAEIEIEITLAGGTTLDAGNLIL
jgi:Ca2+-binding RTX toxin-like protein